MAKAEKFVRSKTVGVRLDPKINYLAELAARYQQRSLSSFIEWAVTRALTVAAMHDDEPTCGTEFNTEEPLPLWMEGMWDVDEADRFYLLGSRPDLMTIDEQRMWKLFQICDTGGDKSIRAFRDFWNHPMIDTAHLQATASQESGE